MNYNGWTNRQTWLVSLSADSLLENDVEEKLLEVLDEEKIQEMINNLKDNEYYQNYSVKDYIKEYFEKEVNQDQFIDDVKEGFETTIEEILEEESEKLSDFARDFFDYSGINWEELAEVYIDSVLTDIILYDYEKYFNLTI